MSPFTGLSAFPITPASTDGRVDLDNLGLLLDRLVAAKVDSIGLLGSTGTYAYLSLDERMRTAAFAAKHIGGACPLIVSIGTIRTDDAQRLAEHAASVGASGLLMAPVSYTPLSEDECFAHYRAVAATTDLPLCIYDNPSTTHFNFSTTLLARLAVLPLIQATKTMVAPDNKAHLETLRKALPGDFHIGVSGDWGCADALAHEADAWFSVIGGILPELGMALARAGMARDMAEVTRLNALCAPLWALFQTYGSLRVVYAIAQQLGLTVHALPRPLLPLPADAHDQVKAVLPAIASKTQPL